MLLLDRREGIAAERQPDRRVGNVDERDQHICELGGITRLVVAEAGNGCAHLARRCIAGLAAMAAALGRESVADLCFSYARAQPWLAGIVVGAETAVQMAENIRLFRTPALTPNQAAAASSLPSPLPEQLLNPALWPQR